LVRGSPELDAAAADYICVRITDLGQWDLALARWDFDLTFAALLMHADGTVYHRYGGRGPGSAEQYLSLTSLARLLRDTLGEHIAYAQRPSPPPALAPRLAIDLPVLQKKRARGQQIDCVHCHTVNDAEHVDAVLGGRWRREELWQHPDPARIGLTLDREHQAMVTAVAPGSPAAKVGIAPGDTLLSLGGQRSVRTFSDVQWALHQTPFGGGEVPVRFRSGKAEVAATLVLAEGWKRCTPEDYAWRPYKWNLSPAAGFGGPALDTAAKQKLGLEPTAFAFRVQYLVDWGEKAHRGRAAKAAGLQKGDVVVAFGGRSDFVSMDHFHAFVALAWVAGAATEIKVLRGGQRLVLRYALPE
jgi:serine protease Do